MHALVRAYTRAAVAQIHARLEHARTASACPKHVVAEAGGVRDGDRLQRSTAVEGSVAECDTTWDVNVGQPFIRCESVAANVGKCAWESEVVEVAVAKRITPDALDGVRHGDAGQGVAPVKRTCSDAGHRACKGDGGKLLAVLKRIGSDAGDLKHACYGACHWAVT